MYKFIEKVFLSLHLQKYTWERVTMSERVAIVCMKWGTAFSADYVNILYSAVKRNMSRPFHFYCLTDDATGLGPAIISKSIPDIGLTTDRWRRGCWPKLAIFKANLFEENIALFLDLDLLVIGSLDPWVERIEAIEGLHTLREWNPALVRLLPLAMRPDRGVQSSILGWRVNSGPAILDLFLQDSEKAFRIAHNDQSWLSKAVQNRHYFPDNWSASFKRACLWYYPMNILFKPSPPPPTSSVIVFHGKPRPSDLVDDGVGRWGTRRKFGFGPVDWVQAYWRRGLE